MAEVAVGGLVGAVISIASQLGGIVSTLLDQLENIVRYAYRWVRENVRRVTSFVVSGARMYIRQLADVLRRLGHHLLSSVREGARFITRYVMNIVKYYANNWGAMFRWLVRAGFKEPEYGFAMIVFVREIFMPT